MPSALELVPSALELLAAYDAQVRARVPAPLPAGIEVARDGPLVRSRGASTRTARRGRRFVPEETETIVIAAVADLGGGPAPPEGVSLRETTTRVDLDRIAQLEQEVWQEEGPGSVADMLEGELAVDPDGLAIVLAEAGEALVSAAWIRFEHETEFATLWAGATLPAWQRRGIYRALVAHRARMAEERGYRFLEVDASDDSRPILERLWFVAVTTTTPYVWRPS